MTDGEYTIRLTPDEALVLSDWLHRMTDLAGFRALVDRDRAVWAPLHRVAGALETTLPEIFAADYGARVDAARPARSPGGSRPGSTSTTPCRTSASGRCRCAGSTCI